MQEQLPVLISCKPLKDEFRTLNKIVLSSENFKIGRALGNDAVLAHLSISRSHCHINRITKDEWAIVDTSTFGIEVNGKKIGKGNKRTIHHNDIIKLEPTEELVYKFICDDDDHEDLNFTVPKKRIKLENNVIEENVIIPKKNVNEEIVIIPQSNLSEEIFIKPENNCREEIENEVENNVIEEIVNSVKVKFEQSQHYEIQHIEEKIENTKQLHATTIVMKDQLESEMNRKVQQLESKFQLQIENLEGEKDEVQRQKELLIVERDNQLKALREMMESQINELMDQIKKHNESESELIKENNLLKENMQREREEFLAELNRESSSKQDLLDKLEAKIREQEEIRLKEKQELQDLLQKETEQLRLAKEKELKELEEQKRLKELELQQELIKIKQNMEKQIEETEQNRQKVEHALNEQIEKMKMVNDKEKAKTDQMVQESEEIKKLLNETQVKAEKSIEALKETVRQREIELAALAADRIQKHADQSSQFINSLQEQLAKARSQLQSVETEKKTLLKKIDNPSAGAGGEGSSKQDALVEVGELMESELQCSICAELFVSPTTLNCSHTFCKYCITMWKKKKKECPNCRTPIISECKSLALDSFIEKMVQNLPQDMKQKREELLIFREELQKDLTRQNTVEPNRGSVGNVDSGPETISDEHEPEEEEEEEYGYHGYDDYDEFISPAEYWGAIGSFNFVGFSDFPDSSDSDSDTGDGAAASNDVDRRAGRDNSIGTGIRRRRIGVRVPGIGGAYYGGYGRCYACGARGHWAPGCPFR